MLIVAVVLTCCRASAKDSMIQCANLIYAGTHSSRCFSDEFLSAVQRQTAIPSERHFKSVKLASDELFQFPFVIMTGEADFHFSSKERENLRRYLTSGGFLLASAGCSNKAWDQAFRREMKLVLPENPLKELPMDHLIFRTAKKIDVLKLTHGGEPARLSGIDRNGKTMVIYSPHGLNDTAHTEGCCCCGGNEIGNSLEMNVNILVYALLY